MTLNPAVFESGRPVLFVPYIGAPASHPAHALIAWDASQQSARAVHDAMPMLEKVDRVSVLTIDAKKHNDDHGEEPSRRILEQALETARSDTQAQIGRMVKEFEHLAEV